MLNRSGSAIRLLRVSHARGATAWSQGRPVCWRCGYDTSSLAADAACPECGAPLSLSLVAAPLSLTRSQGVAVALCQLSVAIALGATLALPIALSPENDRSVHALHPVIWGPPVALFLLAFASLLVLKLTAPPAPLGLSWLWRGAGLSAALTGVASLVFLAIAVALFPGSGDGIALFLAALLACSLGTCALVGWAMEYTMRRLREARQAARWRCTALMYFTALLATCAALLMPVQLVGSSGEVPWVAPAGLAVVAILAALITTCGSAVGFVVGNWRTTT